MTADVVIRLPVGAIKFNIGDHLVAGFDWLASWKGSATEVHRVVRQALRIERFNKHWLSNTLCVEPVAANLQVGFVGKFKVHASRASMRKRHRKYIYK